MSARRTALPAWARIVRESLSAYESAAIAAAPDGVIRAPLDVFNLLRERAEREEQEVFYCIILNAKSRPLAVVEVSRGILSGALVHPREVFRLAIAYGAAGVIVAHNHPSGDPTPSADDRGLTRNLVEAGKVLDIPVYDHVVIGAGRYVSFSESGLL